MLSSKKTYLSLEQRTCLGTRALHEPPKAWPVMTAAPESFGQSVSNCTEPKHARRSINVLYCTINSGAIYRMKLELAVSGGRRRPRLANHPPINVVGMVQTTWIPLR